MIEINTGADNTPHGFLCRIEYGKVITESGDDSCNRIGLADGEILPTPPQKSDVGGFLSATSSTTQTSQDIGAFADHVAKLGRSQRRNFGSRCLRGGGGLIAPKQNASQMIKSSKVNTQNEYHS